MSLFRVHEPKMILWLALWQISLVLALQDTDETPKSIFNRWFAYIVSRGVYFILAVLIAACFVVTTIKKKFEESRRHIFGTERSAWSEDDDRKTMKEKLYEAEAALKALKLELEIANRSRIELENSLESIEKERSYSEDEVIRMKMEGALEVENLKKESMSTERQLQRALNERDDLTRQLEVLRREARISDSALRDQQSLTERLEAARTEIYSLKEQMRGMKVERDTAVRLASDLMERAKGVAHRSAHQRQLIEDMIDAELKRAREDDESEATEVSTCQVADPDSSSACHCQRELSAPPEDHNSDSDLAIDKITEGDSHTPSFECRQEGEGMDDSQSCDEPSSIDEEDKSGIVTGSPAFRAFLDLHIFNSSA